jgi:hypothetical protein
MFSLSFLSKKKESNRRPCFARSADKTSATNARKKKTYPRLFSSDKEEDEEKGARARGGVVVFFAAVAMIFLLYILFFLWCCVSLLVKVSPRRATDRERERENKGKICAEKD